MSRLTCKDCIHDGVCRLIHGGECLDCGQFVPRRFIHGGERLAGVEFMPRWMGADLAHGADMRLVGGDALETSDGGQGEAHDKWRQNPGYER